MKLFSPRNLLRLLGGVFTAAGFLAWIALAWRAVSDLEGVSPENEEGSRLMGWAVAGTVLMILGAILLHFAVAEDERDDQGESESTR